VLLGVCSLSNVLAHGYILGILVWPTCFPVGHATGPKLVAGCGEQVTRTERKNLGLESVLISRSLIRCFSQALFALSQPFGDLVKVGLQLQQIVGMVHTLQVRLSFEDRDGPCKIALY